MFTFRIFANRTSSQHLNKALRQCSVLKGCNSQIRKIHTTRQCNRLASSKLQELQSEFNLQIKMEKDEEYPFDDFEDQVLTSPDFFEVKNMVTLHDLFDARVHFGHKSGCRNEYMTDYLFGSRLEVDIFDLDQTLPLLHDALNFMAHIAYRKGVILFLSRNLQNMHLIEQTAKQCGEYSHCRKWQENLFTNSVRHYRSEIRIPDLCVIFNTKDTTVEQHQVVSESAKLCIPTIGIVDSDCDPRLITFPIPGNDDTPATVQLYCRLFKQAILKGKAARAKAEKEKNDVKN
ncbi:RP-S2 [Mytilus coruscus]|uniref:Small ribosomal subunit protein uS2m n=1 Tax=Mytilus coruscus TaxID=42192 RepID=A0A6J8EDN8_MYTCO|nr:RP-S2 [Mytilus coruscus]